jgi:hypothetical protein
VSSPAPPAPSPPTTVASLPGPTPERPRPAPPRRPRSHNLHRALLALTAVAAAEIVGTVGFHLIEGVGWINAFYFESMLATGQGPPFALATNAGKLFASVMAFVSVGSTLSAVVFTLGPMLARVWRGFAEEIEVGARRVERDLSEEVAHLRDERR